MNDPNFKLGKLPARPGAVKFKLEAYTNFAALPPIPRNFGHEEYTPPIDWGILGNNQYGDCVVAGGAHEHMLWNRMAGRTLHFNTNDVLADFSSITGQPPSANVGADMQQAASYRRRVGLLGADGKRHRIAAYLELQPGNLHQLWAAVYLAGAAGIGFRFPDNGFEQFRKRESWHITSGQTFGGDGHYVPVFASRGSPANLVEVSWGRFQAMRPSAYAAWCDEAVAYFTLESLINNKSPEGLDAAAILADVRSLPHVAA